VVVPFLLDPAERGPSEAVELEHHVL
jgi:hypothetical protein